jgi:hypothetical protein
MKKYLLVLTLMACSSVLAIENISLSIEPYAGYTISSS